MLDGWKVTAAILSTLQGDAMLATLLPDGAWHAQAPPGATRFVIVSMVPPMTNTYVFGETSQLRLAFKDGLYLVEARVLSPQTDTLHAAMTRIGELLDNEDIPVAGFGVMSIRPAEDLEALETDIDDPSIVWNRGGGIYHVMVTPTTS